MASSPGSDGIMPHPQLKQRPDIAVPITYEESADAVDLDVDRSRGVDMKGKWAIAREFNKPPLMGSGDRPLLREPRNLNRDYRSSTLGK